MGRYEWKKGGFYEGEFMKGLREGKGIWVDENNVKYEGTYKYILVQVLLKLISSMDMELKLSVQGKNMKVNMYEEIERRVNYLPKTGQLSR